MAIRDGQSNRLGQPLDEQQNVPSRATWRPHLAELEARLAGWPTEPDAWHGSMVTTPGDLAAFTVDDLDEARSRLRRLALIWEVRLRSLSGERLDASGGDAWTLRQVAFHVAESAFYADSVGALAR